MNRWLDRPIVPLFAVEYVLFHEMLHVKHPLARSRLRYRSAFTRISRRRKTVRTV